MKKNLYLLIACIVMVACDKENDTPPSKTQLLTGGSEKAWNIHSSIPDDLCPTSVDNTWTFSVDGSFEFDRGTNVETEDCSDIINIEGTWAFQNNETTLVVMALRPKGGDDFDEPLELIKATLSSITENEFVLTQAGETGVFRKK